MAWMLPYLTFAMRTSCCDVVARIGPGRVALHFDIVLNQTRSYVVVELGVENCRIQCLAGAVPRTSSAANRSPAASIFATAAA